MISLALSTSATISMLLGVMEDSIEFNFEGGTVAEFVEEVRQHEPGLNVIVDQETAKVAVPAFHVKVYGLMPEMTPGERLIEELLPDLTSTKLMGREFELVDIEVINLGAGDDSFESRLYKVSAPDYLQELDRIESLKHTIAISLASIAESEYEEADLLAAVEAAMQGTVEGLDETTWSIRYHEPTKIAFIVVPHTHAEQAERASRQLMQALAQSTGLEISRPVTGGFGGESEFAERTFIESREAEEILEFYRSQIKDKQDDLKTEFHALTVTMSELRTHNEVLQEQNRELLRKIDELHGEIRLLQETRRPGGGGRGGAGGGGGSGGGVRGGAGGAGGSGTPGGDSSGP